MRLKWDVKKKAKIEEGRKKNRQNRDKDRKWCWLRWRWKPIMPYKVKCQVNWLHQYLHGCPRGFQVINNRPNDSTTPTLPPVARSIVCGGLLVWKASFICSFNTSWPLFSWACVCKRALSHDNYVNDPETASTEDPRRTSTHTLGHTCIHTRTNKG